MLACEADGVHIESDAGALDRRVSLTGTDPDFRIFKP